MAQAFAFGTVKDSVIHEIPGRLPEEGDKKVEVKSQIVKKDVGVQCGDDPEIPNHSWRIHKTNIEILGGKPAEPAVRKCC